MRAKLCIFAFLLFLVPLVQVHASIMDQVSDLITTSAPGFGADHTIQFTTIHAIPAGGLLSITFDPAFTLPPSLDYTDIDVAVWNGSAYIDHDLAALPSGVTDGVTFMTGGSGQINITLSSSAGLPAGSKVQLRVGFNAVVGDVPTVAIVNPTPIQSYRIGILTANALGSAIDYATAMIAIVPQVSVNVPLQNIPPTLLNGSPSGLLAAGNKNIELTLNTDRTASCRYATTSNVLYRDMTNSFSPTKGTFFFTVVGGHQDATTYTYYVRCVGVQGAANLVDYPITFSLDVTPISNTSVSQSGGQVGTGAVTNGSNVLYLSTAALAGFTSPSATVQILKDGVAQQTVGTGVSGSFHADIPSLERGTYTFTMYVIDSNHRKSSPFSSTIAIDPGTSNSLSSIILPPTIEFEKDRIGVGEKVHVFGEATPNSKVEVAVEPRPNPKGDSQSYAATTSAAGVWDIETTSMTVKGTYLVHARQKLGSSQSDFSIPLYVGVGGAPVISLAKSADFNHDGKVNLIDFSILLTAWNSDKYETDLNSDGTTNLADFSILLFNWTG